MNSGDIQKLLYRHFHNYDYKLSNSFIYKESGECDFFAVSKSGYQVEVEIKVSRSDFFVDFKKPKHKFYNASFEKKSHLIIDLGKPHWPEHKSVFGTYDYYTHSYDTRCHVGNYLKHYGTDGIKDQQEHFQMLNNYPGLQLNKRQGYLFGDYTNIRIFDIETVKMPHRLYYAAPKGLLKREDIPKYAGLIEADGYVVQEIIKAPYIHKRSQDINHVLLKKFYYECIDWRNGTKKLSQELNQQIEL